MSRILDPTNSNDVIVFNAIKDLAETDATPAEINANPLFRLAENYIITLIPSAALPDGRTNESRSQITLALEFLTASYFHSGGGDTATKTDASTTVATGDIESQTVSALTVTKTTRYVKGSTSQRTSQRLSQLSVEDRAQWLKDQADAIIEALGGTPTDTDGLGSMVLLTDSRLC